MPDTEKRPDEPAWLTVADLFTVVLGNWKALGIATAVGIVLAIVYLLIASPVYEGTVVIKPVQVRPDGQQSTSGIGAIAMQLGFGGAAGDEITPYYVERLLETEDLIETVLRTTLHDTVQWCPGMVVVPTRILDCFVSSDREPEFDDPGRDSIAMIQAAVEDLRSGLSISVSPISNTVDVSVRAPTRELALLLTEAVLLEGNRRITIINQSQSQAEGEFLETQLKESQEKLSDAEDAVQRFLETNRSFQGSPDLEFRHQRLQRRAVFMVGVVEELEQRVQNARISQVRDTPILAPVDGPNAPIKPVWPSTALVLVAATLLVGGGTYFFLLVKTLRASR